MRMSYNFLCIPNQSISVFDLMKNNTSKTNEEIIKTINITGVRTLRRSKTKVLSSFILSALTLIREKYNDIFDGVDGVVVVSQTYDLRIPSISTQIQAQLKTGVDTFCIDINDGCAGFIKATAFADMLQQQGKERVLIVAGDMNSVITSQSEISTQILFGDGISISIFEKSADSFSYQLFNDGSNFRHITCESNKSVMEMNGFEVFRFTRNAVPKLVSNYFSKHQLTKEKYNLIGFHQASLLVVDELTKTTGLTNTFGDNFNCGDMGNLGAGSIGAWLANLGGALHDDERRMLAIGYGAGLSWGLSDFFLKLSANEVVYVDR